jgi:DNA-binding NarL/FixJ family response regulator
MAPGADADKPEPRKCLRPILSTERTSTVMTDSIQILIAEDHALFRQGVRRVLSMEPDLQVTGEAQDGKEAIMLAQKLQPDVILMDINMPKQNGLQATRDIKSAMENVAIIVLTAYDDEEQLFLALRSGASAYFSKEVLPDTLINAIRVVSQGKYVVGEQIMDHQQLHRWLLRRFEDLALNGGEDGKTLMPLTSREMEILEHITRGASNKAIAQALGISQQTVKNHMSSILRKLSVADRTEAAVLALRRGWIRLQDTKLPVAQDS